MPRVRTTRQAELDLLEIWLYIAEDNPGAATRLLHRVDETCRRLAESPHLGRAREQLARGLRSLPVSNYLLFYRHRGDAIELIRVLHGARDLEALFDVEPGDA